MTPCELCGKEAPLMTAMVEGSELNVCTPCGKFGRLIRKPTSFTPKKQKMATPELIETVVSDFAQIVREAREKSGMTQKDFANSLGEKESTLHKIENGTFTPPITLARKLEKLLKITLVETEKEEIADIPKKQSGGLTIGDFIKIRK